MCASTCSIPKNTIFVVSCFHLSMHAGSIAIVLDLWVVKGRLIGGSVLCCVMISHRDTGYQDTWVLHDPKGNQKSVV